MRQQNKKAIKLKIGVFKVNFQTGFCINPSFQSVHTFIHMKIEAFLDLEHFLKKWESLWFYVESCLKINFEHPWWTKYKKKNDNRDGRNKQMQRVNWVPIQFIRAHLSTSHPEIHNIFISKMIKLIGTLCDQISGLIPLESSWKDLWSKIDLNTKRKTCSTAASWHAVTRASLSLHSKQAWMHSDCASCTVTVHHAQSLRITSETWVFCTSTGCIWASFPCSGIRKMEEKPELWLLVPPSLVRQGAPALPVRIEGT